MDASTRQPAEQAPTRRPQADDSAHRSATSGYLRKWLLLGITIGVVAGLGAVVFYLALKYTAEFLLGYLAGYHIPTPARRGRQPRVDRFPPSVGDSVGDDGRRAAVGVDRGPVRPGSHRSRHRRSHRGGARRSPRHPLPGGAGEDGGQRADHRLGRFGRPRRPDGTDLGRLLLVADPTAAPVRRGRPDRGGAGYRRGHRRDLRRAAGRGGAGRVDAPTATTSTTAACCPVSSPPGRRTRCSGRSWASTRCSATSTPSIASKGPGRCCGSSCIGLAAAAVGYLYARTFHACVALTHRSLVMAARCRRQTSTSSTSTSFRRHRRPG